jgi:polysaccharide export outer membrane protein
VADGDPDTGLPSLPSELNKVNLPTYRIETPDMLLINALRVVPLPPYRIEPLDALLLVVEGTPPAEPINGVYPVETDGTIDLGRSYGNRVKVVDKTVDEAKAFLTEHLKQFLKDPKVSVSLAQARGIQDIRGEHLVGPDGTVRLGVYGSVRVCGMTLDEAKAAIEQHLGRFLFRPQLSVDVIGYNSKVYYVVTDGGGNGEQVVRLPATGNETVLDAISYINGLPPVASKKRIWVSRPAPPGCPRQILPVDWNAVVRGGETETNYQILPGDRVYVMAKPLVTFDTALARVLSPVERVLGVTLLGASTVSEVRTAGSNNVSISATR